MADETRSLLDEYKSSLPSQYPSVIFEAEPAEIETVAAHGHTMSYQITLANDSTQQYLVAVLVDDAGNLGEREVVDHPGRGLLLLEVKDWRLDSIRKLSKLRVEIDTPKGRKTVANPI